MVIGFFLAPTALMLALQNWTFSKGDFGPKQSFINWEPFCLLGFVTNMVIGLLFGTEVPGSGIIKLNVLQTKCSLWGSFGPN